MTGIRVRIPLKIVTGSSKLIIGPYRLVRDHYYVALGFNAPSPLAVRWELHIIADPRMILGGWRQGTAALLGFKNLVKYEGDWRELKAVFSRSGAKGSLHIPPWGVPLLLLADVRPVDERLRALMDLYGLSAAVEFLNQLDVEILEE